MKLMDAKELVLGLMWAEQPETARLLMVDPDSPDGDPGSSSLMEKSRAPSITMMAGMFR